MTQTRGPAKKAEADARDDEDPEASNRFSLRKAALLAPQLSGILDILAVVNLVEEGKVRDLLIVVGLLLVGGPLLYVCSWIIRNPSDKRFGAALIVSLFLGAAVGGFANIA